MYDTYLDSRGSELPAMSFSEALDHIYAIAIRRSSVAAGSSLITDACRESWEQAALDTLRDLVADQHEHLDTTFAPPASAGNWPRSDYAAFPEMSPYEPVNAIRICLAMAEDRALRPDQAFSIELADKIDLEQQAIDLTRDLLGLYGRDFCFDEAQALAA